MSFDGVKCPHTDCVWWEGKMCMIWTEDEMNEENTKPDTCPYYEVPSKLERAVIQYTEGMTDEQVIKFCKDLGIL